jgi:hypothetical protein
VALCQEKATLYCGNLTLSWLVFETSILALWQCKIDSRTAKPPSYATIVKINRTIALAQTTAQFRMTSNCNHTEHHGLSMLWLLLTNRSALATDPRDYIYGLLGMAKPDDTQDSRMFITPDYALDAAGVYQRVTERFLARFPTFTILSYLRLRHPIHPKPHDLSLPSWVIDWSADSFADLQIPPDIDESCQHGVTEWYDACFVKLYPKVHEIDGRLPKVSGLILDYIVECSPLDVVKEALQRYQTITKRHLAVISFMGLHRATTVWKYDHDSEQAANGGSSIATFASLLFAKHQTPEVNPSVIHRTLRYLLSIGSRLSEPDNSPLACSDRPKQDHLLCLSFIANFVTANLGPFNASTVADSALSAIHMAHAIKTQQGYLLQGPHSGTAGG